MKMFFLDQQMVDARSYSTWHKCPVLSYKNMLWWFSGMMNATYFVSHYIYFYKYYGTEIMLIQWHTSKITWYFFI